MIKLHMIAIEKIALNIARNISESSKRCDIEKLQFHPFSDKTLTRCKKAQNHKLFLNFRILLFVAYTNLNFKPTR